MLLGKAPPPQRPASEEIRLPAAVEDWPPHGVDAGDDAAPAPCTTTNGPMLPREQGVLLDLSAELGRARPGSMRRELDAAATLIATFPPEWLLRRSSLLRSLLGVLQAVEHFALPAVACLEEWLRRLKAKVEEGVVQLEDSAHYYGWDLMPFSAAVEILEAKPPPLADPSGATDGASVWSH